MPSHGANVPSRPYPPATSAPLPIPTTTLDPDDVIYNDEIRPVNEDHDLITDPYSSGLSKPGQYLIASHPWFGTHIQDLSPQLNPFRIPGQIRDEVKDFVGNLFTFGR